MASQGEGRRPWSPAIRARPRSVTVVEVERLFTVEFGPSRSKRFGKAVAEAQRGARECSEVEPGRYRAKFLLGEQAAAYAALASLLGRVRHWRASEAYEGEEPVSVYAKEMGWCAAAQLKSFGACHFRFSYGVFPRCSLCPLFDAERAIRDVLGENDPPPATVREITLGPLLRALLGGELANLADDPGPDSEVPDFPPEGWGELPRDEPALLASSQFVVRGVAQQRAGRIACSPLLPDSTPAG